MQRERRRSFFQYAHRADIAHDRSVRPYSRQIRKIIGKKSKIIVPCEYIRRYVRFFAQRMRIVHGFFQIFRVEIIRKRPQRKVFSAQIHGVGAEIKRRFQF